MPFEPGATIGSYRLIEQLGQGGMASVYKAYHASLDRFVAIKVMHVAFNEDASLLARFRREARVVARLEHPNIVPIYDFAEAEGRPYLVMKFIEGETLKSRLERGRMSPAEILMITETVGAALTYAHRQGVLHRDVKPSNVLLSQDGMIYLADFGLARIAQSGESSLTADRLVGTPQYISPEQALSRADLDERTDVYSFGVMLYELLVGKVPFNADTPFAIIHDHIYTPLPWPRQINPELSEAVERVLVKALAKDRDERFADVSTLVAALRAALSGETLMEQMVTALPVIPLAGAAPTVMGLSQPSTNADAEGANFAPYTFSPASIPVYGVAEAPDPLISAAQAVPAYPSRRKWTPLWIGLGIAGIFILLLIAWASGRSNQARQVQGTQTAVTRPTAVLDPAVAAAIEAWKKGDLAGATARLNSAVKATGDDAAFYKDALDLLLANKAWLLAGMLMFSPDAPRQAQTMLTQRDRSQQIHMALYFSAGDPLAGDFLKKNADRVLFFKVAPIRYEMLFGDAAKAKQAMSQVLEPEQLRLYPEARLLEVEMAQRFEPAKARPKLNALLKEKDLPEWVLKIAQDLDTDIPK